MMSLHRYRMLAPLSFVLAGCGTLGITPTSAPDASAGWQYVQSEAALNDLQRHVFTLASGEFEGREAGSDGERKAADYVARVLDEAGVLPGAVVEGERAFLQPFELDVIAFDTASTYLDFYGMEPVRLGREWVAFPDHTPAVLMDSVEIVFAGHGISAPDQGHDDYAELYVGGRVVVALSGAPPGLDSMRTFSGVFGPGDFLIKWIAAVQRGAAALIVVGEENALEAWPDYANLATGRSMNLSGEEQHVPIMPYVFLSDAFGDEVLRTLGVANVATARETDALVGISLLPRRSHTRSQNVVGVVRGAEEHADEFVAIGAHYDHLGLSDESVFYGADDNASGVAAVLVTATAMVRDAAGGDRRSTLFVFHGAEEKGLLGARYFVRSLEKSVAGTARNIVAHVNLDMVGREHPDSLYVTGAYRMSSELGELVDAVNTADQLRGPPFAFDRTYDDPEDPERIFERSDHIAYARQGIPVVFFTDGMGANWRKGTPADDYHRVTDTPDRIDFEKLSRVTRLVYAVGSRAADASVALEVDGVIPEGD